jgi:hypothetical protein
VAPARARHVIEWSEDRRFPTTGNTVSNAPGWLTLARARLNARRFGAAALSFREAVALEPRLLVAPPHAAARAEGAAAAGAEDERDWAAEGVAADLAQVRRGAVRCGAARCGACSWGHLQAQSGNVLVPIAMHVAWNCAVVGVRALEWSS